MIAQSLNQIQQELLAIYERERAKIEHRTDNELADILHYAEELIHSKTFTERTGAEIIRTAAQMTIDARKDNKP